MFPLPEIFNRLDSFFLASASVILLVIFLFGRIRSEVCPRTCDFCRKRVPPDEHAHHVTVCALKAMLLRELRR
jgi:hypothetical protein